MNHQLISTVAAIVAIIGAIFAAIKWGEDVLGSLPLCERCKSPAAKSRATNERRFLPSV
jgi:hypothetical protein